MACFGDIPLCKENVMNRLENKVGKICSLLEQSMVMFLQSYVRLPILLIQVDNLSCL